VEASTLWGFSGGQQRMEAISFLMLHNSKLAIPAPRPKPQQKIKDLKATTAVTSHA